MVWMEFHGSVYKKYLLVFTENVCSYKHLVDIPCKNHDRLW